MDAFVLGPMRIAASPAAAGVARVCTEQNLSTHGAQFSVFVRNSSSPQGRQAQALEERCLPEGGCRQMTGVRTLETGA
jgi:hypothetical protein